VGGVCGVDEGVHSGTVGAGGNRGRVGNDFLSLDWSLLELLSLNWSLLELLSLDRSLLELLSLDRGLLELLSLNWGLLELLSLNWGLDLSWSGPELSSVDVGLEVEVGGVGGVDEGVEVCVSELRLDLLDLLDLWGGSYKSRLGGGRSSLRLELLSLLDRSDRSLLGREGSSLRLLRFAVSNLWIKRSALQSVGSLGDMSALQDPEPVLPGGVPHGDGLPVLVNVAVLSDPFPVSGGLLPEHRPVLLGEGGPEPAVASVEPLLLQDLGILSI